MTLQRLVLGADHRGLEAARRIADRLTAAGHEVRILGCTTGESCDYPDQAWQVGSEVAAGKADLGILICGSGIGMSMAANKVNGVRAALVHDEITAEMSRSHNNANVLCLSADLLGAALIDKIVERWLKTPFEGGRHARRVKKIAAIELGQDPSSFSE